MHGVRHRDHRARSGRGRGDHPDRRGRGVAPNGKTPVRPILSQRKSVSYLSAISNSGLLRFMVLTKAVDAPTRITFLRRLRTDAGCKVVLLLDNLNVHMAKAVRA
ncbi:MAG: transposase [Gemmatimonadota bacterium]